MFLELVLRVFLDDVCIEELVNDLHFYGKQVLGLNNEHLGAVDNDCEERRANNVLMSIEFTEVGFVIFFSVSVQFLEVSERAVQLMAHCKKIKN